MQFAVVNGKRMEAFTGGRGKCPICDSVLIAKCGKRVIHHWAHDRKVNCDPWWETETPWHRSWKDQFPEEFREVTHIAPDGEIHRADVKTSTGIVIEFQHSTMSDNERESREDFYENLVWVLDGAPFAKNFDIYHMLPDPTSNIASDIVWAKAKRNYLGTIEGMYFQWSEAKMDDPNIKKCHVKHGWIHSLHEIRSEVEHAYRGHHQYDWVRPRKIWLEARCPVYIDFGTDLLVHLTTYDESELPCIRYVAKSKFVRDAMVETHASEIATRFYPLHDS